MGSFSWTRAEITTQRSNLTDGDSYKILVPKEFGGGYIKDIYYDYGYIFCETRQREEKVSGYVDGDGNFYHCSEFPTNDLYGLLAYWNGCDCEYEGEVRPIFTKDILLHGKTRRQENRCKGIDIGCYDEEIDKLKYPLKLVSASYRGTYEDCKGVSYGDPEQGFGAHKWNEQEYRRLYNRVKELNNI